MTLLLPVGITEFSTGIAFIFLVSRVCVSKNVEEEVTPAAFGLMSFLNWS